MEDTELNYLPIEKLVLALIIASRCLHHYFDAHPIKFDFHSNESFFAPSRFIWPNRELVYGT